MRPYRTPYGEIRHEIAERRRLDAERLARIDKRSDAERAADGIMEWIALAAVLATVLVAAWRAWPR